MFENFKKINIKGGCFESGTELEVFKECPISVVFGRNGSGKTTIARSFIELLKPIEERNPDFTVTSDAIIPDDKKGSVFVFNEDFIRDQVRVENEGINTIVMLGEQVEIDNVITGKKTLLERKKSEYTVLNEENIKFNSSKESISPLFYLEKIKGSLRANGGWADVDRDLKGNTVKSHITEDVINKLLELPEPPETYEELRNTVTKDLKLYKESENAQPISWIKPTTTLPQGLHSLNEFLRKPVDAPKLSDREKRLLDLLAAHPNYTTEQTKILLNEDWHFCPTCLREITAQDRENISKTLTDILNKEADEYSTALQDKMTLFNPIEITLPVFGGSLNEAELNHVKLAQDKVNALLEKIRETINQRKADLYNPIINPFLEDFQDSYDAAIKDWNDSLCVLEQCVAHYNEYVNKRNKLYGQVRDGNFNVARKQLAPILASYSMAVENRKRNQKELETKKNECELLEGEIKSLIAQKERTDIALEYINKELQYVFFSCKKMKLVPGNGYYKLLVNGKTVRPGKISIGERNALGLCYFFAKLFGGKTETDKYASEYLIVIDDPVSSFDYGNRVGVMSLLRYQFNNIRLANEDSRILVMSHDLHSIFDLVKIRSEVSNRKDKTFMELANCKLEVQKVQNEYKKMIDHVYSYACDSGEADPDETLEISIGNIMRRMLEAFSSFCYNDSFEPMLRKEDLLSLIPHAKQSYYRNFMYRLTLNTESHMAESMYSLNSITSHFTREEKIQTAKSVLLFLYYVNQPHLSAYLSPDQINQIEEWQTEEKDWLLTALEPSV